MNQGRKDHADRFSELLQPGEPRSMSLDGRRLPGVELVALARHEDDRGWFLKLFQADAIITAGGDPKVAEVFISVSHRGVVRGLHFQTPPEHHAKTVVCLAGRAFDVVVDLRRSSPTEGQAATFRLDGDAPARLHVPAGLAHGFQALVDGTVLAYVTSTGHAPTHDQGIRWDSVGVEWPLAPAAISERDSSFSQLDGFASPFTSSNVKPADA